MKYQMNGWNIDLIPENAEEAQDLEQLDIFLRKHKADPYRRSLVRVSLSMKEQAVNSLTVKFESRLKPKDSERDNTKCSSRIT
jgi:hypothetical protein